MPDSHPEYIVYGQLAPEHLLKAEKSECYTQWASPRCSQLCPCAMTGDPSSFYQASAPILSAKRQGDSSPTKSCKTLQFHSSKGVFTFAKPILKSKQFPVFLTPTVVESHPRASWMRCKHPYHPAQTEAPNPLVQRPSAGISGMPRPAAAFASPQCMPQGWMGNPVLVT